MHALARLTLPQPYSIRRKVRVVRASGSEDEDAEKYKCLLLEALSRESNFSAKVLDKDQKLDALQRTVDELKEVYMPNMSTDTP